MKELELDARIFDNLGFQLLAPGCCPHPRCRKRMAQKRQASRLTLCAGTSSASSVLQSKRAKPMPRKYRF